MTSTLRRTTCAALAMTAAVTGCGKGGGGGGHGSAEPQPIVRVDRVSAETTPYAAHDIHLSGAGRYAVFTSNSSQLVPDKVYFLSFVRIYRKDLATGELLLLSRPWGPDGTFPTSGYPLINADTNSPSISDDGRYVAFSTTAGLVASDSNGLEDVYVLDLETRLLERISVGPGGVEPNNPCILPRISGDGSTVVWQSNATNLVAGDGNASIDVFARRRSGAGAGATRRISVDGGGGEHAGNSILPCVNRDGTRIAFESHAALVAGDTNFLDDVYRATIDWSTTAAPVIGRVSRGWTIDNPDGDCGSPAISADGSKIAFASTATNLIASDTNGHTDVFLFDYDWLTTTRASVVDFDGGPANGDSDAPAISGDGRWVAFASSASNLVLDDSNTKRDVFVRDTMMGHTHRLSVGLHGEQNDGDAASPSLSADGSAVGFEATGDVLPGGSASSSDVYRALTTPSAGG